MTGDQTALIATAATIGVVHAAIGPDHYLPFITLARARNWSLRRTLAITVVSGLGHVAGSLALAVLAVAAGWALGGIERFEAARGALAGWLLLGFGLAYLAWGLRHALRARPHTHRHEHADGTVHEHLHGHLREHAHPHPAPAGGGRLGGLTAFSLFAIFVVGPCEPLVPLLLYPAAAGSTLDVAIVAAVFALATITTMAFLVGAGRSGLALLPAGDWQRWSHAAAGAVVAACGLAIQLGL